MNDIERLLGIIRSNTSTRLNICISCDERDIVIKKLVVVNQNKDKTIRRLTSQLEDLKAIVKRIEHEVNESKELNESKFRIMVGDKDVTEQRLFRFVEGYFRDDALYPEDVKVILTIKEDKVQEIGNYDIYYMISPYTVYYKGIELSKVKKVERLNVNHVMITFEV